MRYVSINSVPYGSTGAVMRQVTEERRAAGDECWMMWGRGRAAENDHEFNFGSKAGFYLDVLQTRVDGRAGFHSHHATKLLLEKLSGIEPDVVHLHNVHGYYVNVEMLFGWLAAHENVQVRWTLHDCWAFTGHCAHFQYVGCDGWVNGTCGEGCPQLGVYPKTLSKRSCAWNYAHKKAAFTQLPADRMTLVTPSRWLKDLVERSFLAKYPVEVRHNIVDTGVFKPTPSDFRERYGIGGRYMVLGVASPWTEGKGLGVFYELSGLLDTNRFAIVLVGLSKKQIVQLPAGIIGLERIDSPQELAAIYTAADVLVNPSIEETFGMTVAEAKACDTKSLVMQGSACAEICFDGAIVEFGDTKRIASAIEELCHAH